MSREFTISIGAQTVVGSTTLINVNPKASNITGNTTGAAGQCGVNASAENGGTLTLAHEDAFNVLNGWLMVPTPPETRIMPAGSTSSMSLKFPVIPATATNWVMGLTYREV